jgi:hypothetical protein
MEFHVKGGTLYRELVISLGGATLQSGMLSPEGCRGMAGELRSAADDLVYSSRDPQAGEPLIDLAPKIDLTRGNL